MNTKPARIMNNKRAQEAGLTLTDGENRAENTRKIKSKGQEGGIARGEEEEGTENQWQEEE